MPWALKLKSGGSYEIFVFAIKQPGFFVIQSLSLKPCGVRIFGLLIQDWLVVWKIPHDYQFVEGINQVRSFFYERRSFVIPRLVANPSGLMLIDHLALFFSNHQLRKRSVARQALHQIPGATPVDR